MNYVGVEIGGTKLQLVSGDEACRIFDRARIKVDPAAGAEGIRRQIAGALPKLVRGAAAIGIGFGGPVDWSSGKIQRSHQIEGWSEFDIAGWMGEMAGIPVLVDNDANVAALGEAVRGAGRGKNPVFYTTLGSGVGGGLVVDGSIYHGASPGEAEIGHIRLESHGCHCRVTLLRFGRSTRAYADCGRRLKGAVLFKLTKGMRAGEARSLREALELDDRAAREILRELAEDLAFAFSHAVHLFHPEAIIIGGGLSQIGEPLRAAVGESLAKYVMEAFHPVPQVMLSALGEDTVPVGALELARRRLASLSSL